MLKERARLYVLPTLIRAAKLVAQELTAAIGMCVAPEAPALAFPTEAQWEAESQMRSARSLPRIAWLYKAGTGREDSAIPRGNTQIASCEDLRSQISLFHSGSSTFCERSVGRCACLLFRSGNLMLGEHSWSCAFVAEEIYDIKRKKNTAKRRRGPGCERILVPPLRLICSSCTSHRPLRSA
jgi:hypothetical protein